MASDFKAGDRVLVEAVLHGVNRAPDPENEDAVVELGGRRGTVLVALNAVRPASPPAVVGSPVPSDAVVSRQDGVALVGLLRWAADVAIDYAPEPQARKEAARYDALRERLETALAHRGSPVGDEERAAALELAGTFEKSAAQIRHDCDRAFGPSVVAGVGSRDDLIARALRAYAAPPPRGSAPESVGEAAEGSQMMAGKSIEWQRCGVCGKTDCICAGTSPPAVVGSPVGDEERARAAEIAADLESAASMARAWVEDGTVYSDHEAAAVLRNADRNALIAKALRAYAAVASLWR